MPQCYACNENIDKNDYLECLRCSQKYHHLCLGLSTRDSKNLTQDYKDQWICPHCLSKQRKGVNENIPVRPTTPTGLAEITFNVARRKANNKSEPTTTQCTILTDHATSSDIKEFREEMRNIMKEYMGKINNTLDTRLREFSEQIQEFKTSLNFLSDQFDKLNNDVDNNSQQVCNLKKENDFLRLELASLSTRFNQMDQQSRATNLEIQCVPEFKSENVMNIIQQIGSITGTKVNEQDISYCSRIAKKNQASKRPRTILVKFTTPRIRDTFFTSVIQFNKKHSDDKLNTSHIGISSDKKEPIFITENLSPEYKNIHAAARLKAKELKYKFTWVRNGRIFLRKDENSETIYVRNLETLDKLKL